MENQKVSLFRQKNRWGLTAVAVVACALLSPLLGMTLFLPQALAVAPLALMALMAYIGPVSAAACTAVFVGLGMTLFGLWGGVAAAALFVPVVVVSASLIDREQPFWQAVAGGGVTMFASMFAVVAMLTLLTGSDVVTALSGVMTQALQASGQLGDMLIGMMVQLGVMALPEGAQIAENGMLTIPADVRAQVVSGLVMLMDSALRLEIPMQMATASVACGLLGQAVMRKGLRHRGCMVEYPPLRTWRVPKGWGRILGGTLLVLYVSAQLVPRSMSTMFYVFSGVFDQVFSLQGIAAVCYMLHKRGKSPRWQTAAFAVGYFALGSICVMLGIADQAMDFSHRREELDKQENPFDPRRGEWQ